MIAQILSVVGLAPSPHESDAHAARAKADADLLADHNREADAEKAEASRLAQVASNKRQAELAKARELAAKTTARLEAEIASDLRAAVAPLWPAFQHNPCRETVRPFVEPIAAAAKRAIECLGADVSIACVFAAFADGYIQKNPALANVLRPDFYGHFGERAGAVLAIVRNAGPHGVDLSRLQAALVSLESTIHAERPRGAVSEKALAEWQIILTTTTVRGLANALEKHRAATTASVRMTTPPAPVNEFKTVMKSARTGEIITPPAQSVDDPFDAA